MWRENTKNYVNGRIDCRRKKTCKNLNLHGQLSPCYYYFFLHTQSLRVPIRVYFHYDKFMTSWSLQTRT